MNFDELSNPFLTLCEQMPEKGDFPKMELLAPAPPQQDNYSDCGVFLLHYVDWMFTRW